MLFWQQNILQSFILTLFHLRTHIFIFCHPIYVTLNIHSDEQVGRFQTYLCIAFFSYQALAKAEQKCFHRISEKSYHHGNLIFSHIFEYRNSLQEVIPQYCEQVKPGFTNYQPQRLKQN